MSAMGSHRTSGERVNALTAAMVAYTGLLAYWTWALTRLVVEQWNEMDMFLG